MKILFSRSISVLVMKITQDKDRPCDATYGITDIRNDSFSVDPRVLELTISYRN